MSFRTRLTLVAAAAVAVAVALASAGAYVAVRNVLRADELDVARRGWHGVPAGRVVDPAPEQGRA